MDKHFNISKKGYEPEEVQSYIEQLESELREFRENESAIAMALIHSENTAQQIVDKANKEAQMVRIDTEKQLLELQKKIKHLRMKLDAFQSSYNQLMHKYIITMNSNDFNELYSSLDKISDSLTLEQADNKETEEVVPVNDLQVSSKIYQAFN